MATIKKLNIKQLLKKNFTNSKALQNLAYGAAKKKSERLKKEALRELNNHIVTNEVEKGPSSGGSTLLGGRGNFFGFLGFGRGQQPIEIIRSAFEDHVKIRNTKGKIKKLSDTSFIWTFDIDIPSMTEIYAVTPLAWSTQSWVRGVEKGITNAANTIFMDSERSRSGAALQTGRKIGFISFSPTPYITPILNKLRKELK